MKNSPILRLAVLLNLGLGSMSLPATTNDFGILRPYAGGGVSPANDIPATNAYIPQPAGLAVDAAGNVFISDNYDSVVRRVDAATHLITTVAGMAGQWGFDGDGGPATNALLSDPIGVAVDAAGENLYFADHFNSRIRKVHLPSGIITTVAGNGTPGTPGDNNGDGGPATNANLIFPEGVAVAANGDIFIADSLNYNIRKVSAASGIISHVAGSTVGPYPFNAPTKVALDSKGNIFVMDVSGLGSKVWRIAGTNYSDVTVVAGGGAGTGESGSPTNANLGNGWDVAVDDHGGVYAASNLRIWRADLITGTIGVFAGTGVGGAGFSGLNGPARTASFSTVGGVATWRGGEVFINDLGEGLVLRVSRNVVVDDANSQAYVSGLTNLTGNVLVNGTILTNLEACQLALLQGHLNLSSNVNLAAFCATNLATVTGDIIVSNDPNLTALDLGTATGTGGSIIVTETGLQALDLGNLESTGGSIIVSNDTNLTTLVLSNLTNVGGDIIVTEDSNLTSLDLLVLTNTDGSIIVTETSVGSVDLGNLDSAGGDIIVSDDADLTSLDLGGVKSVGGDIIVTNDPNLTSLDLGALTNADGSIIVSDTSVGTLNLGSLESTGGDIIVTDDASLTLLDLGSLITTGGNVVITDGTANTILFSELETVGGDVVVSNNPAVTEICATNLVQIGGRLIVSGNTSADSICFDSLTNVTSDMVITDGTANTMTFAESTSVGGDAVVETSGPTNVNLSGVRSSGDVSIIADGASTVSAQTGGGSTSVTIAEGEAVVSVQLTNGTFETNVLFTIVELSPASLPADGLTLAAAPVAVDPVTAYQFTFAVPTLNQDAALSFDIQVALLPDPPAFLAALDAGRITLAVAGDTPGSPLQLFDVCATNDPPVADTCVRVVNLDTNGVPVPPGSPDTPAIVRVEGVVGHFSTYALVTYVPIPQAANPQVSGGAFQFSFTGEVDLTYTVQYTDSLDPPDWQTLTNFSGIGGLLQVIDEPLTNAQRFYRVKIP